MVNEEKELFKFVNNPKYRAKVIDRIHKERDREHEKKVKTVEKELDKLIKVRTDEIKKIANARWEKVAGGGLEINRTEGKVRINGSEHLFSNIQGSELNMLSGFRVVTKEQSHSKSKKHASLKGALAGSILMGPPGTVIGGVGLGKTKTKTTGKSVSNQIPTCMHLGVLVNIDGFISEIVLISSQVDQSGWIFNEAQKNAQTLIAQLDILAHTPVPNSFLKPEEEMSVKAIDNQISNKREELEATIAERPVYTLPAIYRTEEQKEMSDDEYLQYLESTDNQRVAERYANKMALKQEQTERKAVERQRRLDKREIRRNQKEQNRDNVNDTEMTKRVLVIMYNIVFWILSVFYLLSALISFTSSGVLSGILFLLTALLINPKVDEVISDRVIKIPKWAIVVIIIVGFFAGVLTFPSA